MSTPLTLTLPAAVVPARLGTPRGEFAALVAQPDIGVALGTVLCVPGWTGSKEDFAPLLAELTEFGWRAVAVDLRGQYETPGPDDPQAYSLAELGADVVALSRALGGFSQLVGHSFGGLVATHAVLAEPTVFSTGSLLCSGPAGLTDPAKRAALQRLVTGLDQLPIEQVYQMKLAHDAAKTGYRRPPDDIADFLRRRFLGNAATSLAEISRRMLDAPDRVDELAGCGVPVQVLFGEYDDGWPLEVQRAMARRLSTEPEMLAGADHSPAVSAPKPTARALVDFFHDRHDERLASLGR